MLSSESRNARQENGNETMTNFKKILVAGAVALGVTGLAQINASADEVTVKAGDTVSGLADANDTTVESIETLNPEINKETHLIYVGDVLKVNDDDQAQKDEVQAGVGYYYYDEPQAPAVQAPTPVSQPEPVVQEVKATPVAATANDGSVKSQFLAAGGTEAMWSAIVMPESGGNVNATNGQYHGLGQTNQSWGYGSVADQTKGMIEYANSRYGSVSNAISTRSAQGWW